VDAPITPATPAAAPVAAEAAPARTRRRIVSASPGTTAGAPGADATPKTSADAGATPKTSAGKASAGASASPGAGANAGSAAAGGAKAKKGPSKATRDAATPPPRASEPPPSSGRSGSGSDEDEEDQEQPDEELDAVDAAAELVDTEEEVQEEDGGERDTFSVAARTRGNVEDDSKLALSRNDPLQAYLREVQRHPLLTPEEEQTLAQRYAATQNVDAAARLVTANLRLVVKIAYEYRRAYKNIMDLIQEGNIGLMQAVKKYDPNRGVKLSSYSAWWIRAYILRYIINNWRLVKLGTTQAQRKLFFNLNKEKARLSAMGVDPTPERIAKNLGVEEQEAAEMERRLSSGEMSLDAPVGDNEGRPVSRIELMASGLMGPDSTVATEELNDIVRAKLAEFRVGLKGKDLDIFDKRLVADDPLTLQELGDQFGISRERVRQIEARLTMNLRQFLVQALGDAVEV
jgi:RNA polymerase sigma-32 factor